MFTSDELKTELKNRKVKIHKNMTAPVGMVNRGQTVIEARSKLLGNDTVEDLANWIAEQYKNFAFYQFYHTTENVVIRFAAWN